ncbi:MAG TPA: hypothetical protein VM529_19925, partial [Gemmata sp.]|nr:hypothetical protein [Gemmata sp.]
MGRDPFYDNAKFLLMALVINGHAVEPLVGSHATVKSVYTFIYLFHMPCFVVLAGLLTKVRPGWAGLANSTRRLLVPYVAFQILSWLFRWAFSPGGAGSFSLFTPDWVLWFLVSLFWWRALLPLFVAVPFGLPLAVGLGLAVGVVDGIGSPLSLSRTFVFFPYFLAGHLAGQRRCV